MSKDLSQKIKQKAKDLGYIDCGITDISPFQKFEEKVKGRIKVYPEAESFYENMLNRINPRERFSNAKALVVCIWRYGQYKIPDDIDQYIGKNYLFDGRKKYSDNYQIRKEFENYMDELSIDYRKGGVPDRWAAVRAGVGNFGKNNFTYTDYGSWINVETWLIDKKVETVHQENTLLCPEGCRECIKACPTGTLEAPFKMKALSCIPYLTYNRKGITPERYREDMGLWLYGCDVCQNVCPLNKNKWEEKKDYPYLEDFVSKFSLTKIFKMDKEFFENEVYSRFFYSDDINRWKMNALRAMANTGKKKYISCMKEAVDSEDERLQEMGNWGLGKFSGCLPGDS